ncbi:hypothetical protein ACLOJK_008335 [Asimina triloba]
MASSDGEANDFQAAEQAEDERSQPQHHHTGDGASPGQHFGKYGEITDSVIMKDRRTVVDRVILDTHVINGKQVLDFFSLLVDFPLRVEIKRTIPKGAISGKDFKTKKIFVGGIPTTVAEDEFKNFFSKFGEVKEHQIMRDHSTSRSRGFGFITFDTEKAVDDLLAKGNKIEFAGAQSVIKWQITYGIMARDEMQNVNVPALLTDGLIAFSVEIKKAEPKKANPPPPKHFSNPKPTFMGGYGDGYGSFGGGFGASSYRSGGGGVGARVGSYGGYDGSSYGGGYGGYGSSSLGGYRGESSLGYSGRYGGGFGRGYDLGGYGAGENYGGYGGASSGYGSGYETGYDSFGGSGGGGYYGNRGGYGGTGTGRFHPYAR